MSRSKKAPYWKQKATKKSKKSANVAVRQAKVVANGKSYKKHFESWNISDWSFYSPHDPKVTRK